MDVLLAERRAELRSALRLVLEQEPDLYVVVEVETSDELLAQTDAECPDLLLLDWELPGQLITEIIPLLHQRCPNLHVIALSGHPEVRMLTLEAGVDQFISKSDSPDQLLAAIRSVQHQLSQNK